jgi:hypothetical protein
MAQVWSTSLASIKPRVQAQCYQKKQKQNKPEPFVPCNPTTQEAAMRKIVVRNQPGKIVCETLSQKTHYKKKKNGGGLVEWLKV